MLGIDPSLSSTGYAYQQRGTTVTGRITSGDLRGPHRLAYMRIQMEKVLNKVAPSLVVMEDYAMGARGNNMFHIGELGGVFKLLVWDRGIDMLSVPPTTMKSVIAGNGRAGKDMVIAGLLKSFGISIAQHDEADAAGLLLIGEMLRGTRSTDLLVGESDRFDSVRRIKITKGRLQSISYSTS